MRYFLTTFAHESGTTTWSYLVSEEKIQIAMVPTDWGGFKLELKITKDSIVARQKFSPVNPYYFDIKQSLEFDDDETALLWFKLNYRD